ncbi:carboxypeptidase-like regulatory domain-containing protein [Flavivirga eckloniae]|uniref:Carboxypeptidase-like regulatory domain-containing protein n=1 Tax=Flavivirga eckloniae TaxID=1803846 RepID=A0A2K9PNK3_9FLAO|nr:carboxypeptidase-like regulatory domain-containing protein [Flavivirga eckloniae]AUP78408.1 hypothetical protein C1H87_06665 [Flavivirga eckloniae]
MERVLVSFIFIFLPLYISGQSTNRIEVQGVLFSPNNDVEAVTIFNKTSKKGTITNEKGEFAIKVAMYDVIEISALQFQTVTVIIDEDVIKAKQLKIQLVEQVNRLDAVTLSSGLSGVITTDIANIKKVTPIHINMGDMNVDFEYNDEKAFDKVVIQNHLKSVINPEARNYLPDPIKIFKLLFKKDLPVKINLLEGKEKERPNQKYFLDAYDHKYISETFNIPLDQVEVFIVFVEEKGIDSKLFKPENEMQLIEFLIKQRESFLKLQDVKK